jgi:hypothetical protein
MSIFWDSSTPSRQSVILNPVPFRFSFSICLASAENLTLKEQGWTNLPCATLHSGSEHKRNKCVGCQRTISGLHGQLLGIFHDTGFYVKDRSFAPCGEQYHPTCIVAGSSFTTRSPDQRILYPPSLHVLFPFHVCALHHSGQCREGVNFKRPECQLLVLE